mgnify:CR=1 FL=1
MAEKMKDKKKSIKDHVKGVHEHTLKYGKNKKIKPSKKK